MTSKPDETDIDARSYRRLYREESAIAFSAIDCVLNGDRAMYASSELTSGRRAYELLHEHGARDLDELERLQRGGLMAANVKQAVAFARRLRERLGGRELVITPAPYVAPGWSQTEYLVFWETLLRTRIKAAYFNDGWEYSNGCTFEFVIACEHGIPTFDAELRPLARSDGAARIGKAAARLEATGLGVRDLRTHLDRLTDGG